MATVETKDSMPIRRRKEKQYERQNSLTQMYEQMVEDLRKNPYSIRIYKEFLDTILKSVAEDMGELAISADGKDVHFEKDGKSFTDFGLVVLNVTKEHDISETYETVELIVLSERPPSQIIKVPSKKLRSCHWLNDLGAGYMFQPNGVKCIRTVVSLMAKHAPVENVYNYSGWMPGDSNSYILGGRVLQGSEWNMDSAKIPSEHAIQMLEVAPHETTIPLLSFGILSLVKTRLMEKGMYFKGICCIVAPTQSFKTTMASLFYSFDNDLDADINFEATIAAIVRTIGNARDLTIVLDDYKPGATKAEQKDLLQKLSRIARMCSDNSGGIKRAGANNTIIDLLAQCQVIVTAEHINLSVQSTLARLLVLDLNRKSIRQEKLTYFQANADRYRAFIEGYIRHISKLGVDNFCDDLIQNFLQQRNTLRTELDAKGIVVDNRSNDMCCWLYCSFGQVLKYWLDVKAITKEQYDSFSRESREIFLELMDKQATRVSELDDVRQFFKALKVMLDVKQVCIEKLQARNNSFAGLDNETTVGFSKGEFIYLKNGVAFQQVAAYWRRNGKDFAVNEAALRKKLADNRHILQADKKSCIFRLFVNRRNYQCIKFEKAEFDKLLNGGNGNGAEGKQEVPDNRGMRFNAENFLGRGV